MSGGEFGDQIHLLRASPSDSREGGDGGDVEAQLTQSGGGRAGEGGAFRDLLKRLDRGFSNRRHSFKRHDRARDKERDRENPSTREDPGHHHPDLDGSVDVLGDSAPPEWALLLISCLLGLATGLFVAAFNNGVRLHYSIQLHLTAFALSGSRIHAHLYLEQTNLLLL